jgi:hypothetical protein
MLSFGAPGPNERPWRAVLTPESQAIRPQKSRRAVFSELCFPQFAAQQSPRTPNSRIACEFQTAHEFRAMRNVSSFPTLIRILLCFVMISFQPSVLVWSASPELEGQSERSFPDDTHEVETDDSLTLCSESSGRRIVRQAVDEKFCRQLAAHVTAQCVTSQMALRSARDRRIIERVFPLRC